MAEVVADRLLGGEATFPGADSSTKLKLLGVDVGSIGDAHGATPGCESVVYRDEPAGLLDGGLFTLANGTNPEIMLFLEARRDPKGGAKATWQYVVGRLAHAELHLQYDGKEVFEAPRGDSVAGRNRPYWIGSFNLPPEGGPGRP